MSTMLTVPAPLNRTGVIDVESVSKMVDVTITIVSLAGLYFRDAASTLTKGADVTTIVASVSSYGQSPFPRHSSPITITTSSKKSSAEVIQWSSDQSYKSIKFRERFHHENCLLSKCSIDLAISRNGKRYPLGTSSLVINGEERQMKTLHLPIDRVHPMKRKVFNLKRNALPMFKPEGESCMYGLSDDATMRVIVQIETASNDATSLNDCNSSTSIFSFDADASSKSKTTITEYSSFSSKNDDISVGTLTLDADKLNTVTREISGLTSFWEYDNMSLGTDKDMTNASGSTDEVETIETILSTDSESSNVRLNMLDDNSLPSQFGVEVVPYSYCLRATFSPLETPNKILITLPSKSIVMNGIDDKDIKDSAKCDGVRQVARILTRSLRQCFIS